MNKTYETYKKNNNSFRLVTYKYEPYKCNLCVPLQCECTNQIDTFELKKPIHICFSL